jgi:hypothetical protein
MAVLRKWDLQVKSIDVVAVARLHDVRSPRRRSTAGHLRLDQAALSGQISLLKIDIF